MLPGIETRMPTRARSFLRELFSPGRQTEREAVPSLFYSGGAARTSAHFLHCDTWEIICWFHESEW